MSTLGSFSDIMRRQHSAYETRTELSHFGPAPQYVLDAYLNAERFSGLPTASS